MKRFLYLFLLLLPMSIVDAAEISFKSIYIEQQEIKIINSAIAYSNGVLAKDKAKFPLKRVGNLFLVEAEIDSLRGNFIIDLGAPYLVLNSTYFRDYDIDSNFYSGTLLNNDDYVRRTKVNSLKIGDLSFQKIGADVTDLGAIENKRGIKILGLLGLELFKDFVLELELINQQMTIHKTLPDKRENEMLFATIPFKVRNNVILVKGNINGHDVLFSLDSAAEQNVLHNQLPNEVYSNIKILNNTTVRDANGKTTEVLTAIVNGTTIAKKELKGMSTLILNLNTLSSAYGQNIDGMLGYPFFVMGKLIFNFSDKELVIWRPKK